jgi:hypothetical protein
MTRHVPFVVLALASTVAIAPAAALEPPPCDLAAERGQCLVDGRKVEARCGKVGDLCILSGTVRSVRLVESGPGSRQFRLAAMVSEERSGAFSVTLSTDQGRTFALKAGQLTRRASIDMFTDEPAEKSVVTVGLKLEIEDGGTVCVGKASLDLASGKYDAPFVGGETSCDVVRSIQAFPTQAAGTFALAFTAVGDSSAKIAGGTIWTETIGKDGKPVRSSTPLDASSFTSEREYFTAVRFDGDPVGASYDLDVEVSKDGKPVDRLKTSLDVRQLPGGDDWDPGILYGNGSGTKNASTTTSTRPELL